MAETRFMADSTPEDEMAYVRVSTSKKENPTFRYQSTFGLKRMKALARREILKIMNPAYAKSGGVRGVGYTDSSEEE